jgi:hypothetical protein
MNTEMPEYYRAPLVERDAIVAWLLDYPRRDWERRGGHGYEGPRHFDSAVGFTRGPWLFCFNVKLSARMDWSYTALLRAAIDSEAVSAEEASDAHWLAETEKRHGETDTEHLCDVGIESARSSFVGRPHGQPDDDGYSMLWDGTPVDTRFAFMGRSGGWLVLTGFEGTVLAGDGDEVLAEMSDASLNKLYRFLVMLEHDLGGDAPSRWVQAAAASHFFNNVCHDICLTKDLVGAGI